AANVLRDADLVQAAMNARLASSLRILRVSNRHEGGPAQASLAGGGCDVRAQKRLRLERHGGPFQRLSIEKHTDVRGRGANFARLPLADSGGDRRSLYLAVV